MEIIIITAYAIYLKYIFFQVKKMDLKTDIYSSALRVNEYFNQFIYFLPVCACVSERGNVSRRILGQCLQSEKPKPNGTFCASKKETRYGRSQLLCSSSDGPY